MKEPEVVTVYTTRSSRVEACTKCKGSGIYSYEDLVDYHRREYDTKHEKCDRCDGNGRMLIHQTYSVVRLPEETLKGSIKEKAEPYRDNKPYKPTAVSETFFYRIEQ